MKLTPSVPITLEPDTQYLVSLQPEDGQGLLTLGDLSLYLITDGEVSIRIALANADQDYEIIKEQRGDLLGEVRFIDNLPRSATAIAETDVELLVWHSSSWQEICDEDSRTGYRLTLGIAKTLSDRLRRWNVRILDTVEWGIA